MQGYAGPHSKDGSMEIELFLDTVCPFSAKTFKLLDTLSQVPNVSVKIVGIAQPWHSQSAVLHRAVAAVSLAKPETTWAYLGAIYESSAQWSDAETENLTENQILEKAAQLAESVAGIIPSGFIKLCKSSEVVDTLKAHARYARQNSLHVTPSLLFNGCRVADFGSAWTMEDWANFLQNP
jgi:protein-disulfide isomerase